MREDQTICPIGYACSGGDKISCTGVGEYSDVEGLKSCKLAPPGTIPLSDRSGVANCQQGTYSIGSSDECTPCTNKREYSDVEGLKSCKLAPVGTTPLLSRTGIQNCLSGTFSIGGQSECSTCDSNKFSSEGAAGCTFCTSCGVGKYIKSVCTTSSDSKCDVCEPGKSSFGNSTSCTDSTNHGEYATGEGIKFAQLLQLALSLMSQDRKLLIAMLGSIQRMAKIVTLVMTGFILLLDMAFVPRVRRELSPLLINRLVLVASLERIVVLLLMNVSPVRLASLTTMPAFKAVQLVLHIRERMVQPEVLVVNVMKDSLP